MLYEWIKALHVISIIAWMAGLLYLPRLFVYHCQVPAGSETSETFKVMERRLLRAIMNPAMIAAYVFGITMIVLTPEWMKQGWLHAKLLFVLLLTASHMMMARWRRDFAEDRNTRPQRFYRIANEVPTLLMIGIVIFVVVKPF
ncbi:putative membrane protein [Azospirillum lipoferum]|uniref:Protoporphyrinogen IX oxidase n=1 Tax=Azospirillum lipoferum TaxID=193 RepID=A0A5A9GT47_AZOLI|nr:MULTISPECIES: protoporphyrinogen oxidase HemJ [Azospirillum]KAA0597618.1 protoporphyrinogen oxidase HemJ [Azospirillum lipoferum]MCP1610262.1 putative membrane protein [Azospirillum lipoferum]MDW5534245.1 protoporphyrinogen oxidase HemJ [Azospirillum sp. NL1]